MESENNSNGPEFIQPINQLKSPQPNSPTPKSPTSKVNISFSSFINAKSGSYTADYKVGQLLGSGAFAQVKKVTNKKNKAIRAMKILEKKKIPKNEEEKFISEIQVLKQLDHPHILKLYEFYQDSKNYYIIMELCTGGELFDKIIEKGTFSEKEATYVMRQLLSSIRYAHNHNIVHRDLKPENILLDTHADGTYNIKIIDWGTAKVFDSSQKMTERFGTAYYIAPEVLNKSYNEKCDLWSIGVVLYVLLSGTPPFPGKNDKEIIKNVQKGVYDFNGEEWENISDEAKDLINKLLTYDPMKRISAKEALDHKWFETASHLDVKVNEEKMRKNLQNLRGFRAEQKLQQATYAFIASHLASKEEKQHLLETFKALDTNGDGTLSREEILEGYKKTMDEEEAEIEVNRIMAMVDLDKSGEIDYSEFIAATLDRKEMMSKDKLEEAFNMFDKDGSGTITADELKEVLGGKMDDMDDGVWDQIIKEVDTNGDGVISKEEFTEMMLKYADNEEEKEEKK